MSNNVNERRRFLQIGMMGLAATPLLFSQRLAVAEEPKVEESDPTAQALGYVHDATKADVKKFPKKAGPDGATQFCHSCQFYSGAAGAEWGPCSIFPGKQVSAKGWCSAWAKKA